ncbi:hypothetical protein [Nitrosomonas oligotropha]|uniref:hypothetical protein n=1 Tax=Nitrosomonas oligotropha TaxID=42354 RepID=UPI00136C5FE0|nr:hypothetical protein [Nitrosomonas oligotropha]MXS81578.1 hypothetical protein [Nitrosomonas oligotropha]
MDIRKFAVSPTSELHLRDANDELMYADEEKTKPITVNLYGPGSKEYARAQAAQSNRMVDKLKRKGKTEQSAEQRAAESAQFLSDCTESWDNLEYGELTGRELSIAVYSDITIGFIADQVVKHISDWVNFTKPSTTN